jgi:hypothetical protein
MGHFEDSRLHEDVALAVGELMLYDKVAEGGFWNLSKEFFMTHFVGETGKEGNELIGNGVIRRNICAGAEEFFKCLTIEVYALCRQLDAALGRIGEGNEPEE